ncbi:MAG: hypothetical protein D3908_07605 [Candidatus Electrothrix sp. AUS4]|nr:hypothetical protein [Candidatus Electrothrix sp. AUS4]
MIFYILILFDKKNLVLILHISQNKIQYSFLEDIKDGQFDVIFCCFFPKREGWVFTLFLV